jgi:hypothetical protein
MTKAALELTDAQLFLDKSGLEEATFVGRQWHQPSKFRDRVLRALLRRERRCPTICGPVLRRGGAFEMWYCTLRIGPAEAAEYLDLSNVTFVRFRYDQAWPTEEYLTALRPMERVVWSIVGVAGKTEGDETAAAIELASRYPNLGGIQMGLCRLTADADRAHGAPVRNRAALAARRTHRLDDLPRELHLRPRTRSRRVDAQLDRGHRRRGAPDGLSLTSTAPGVL